MGSKEKRSYSHYQLKFKIFSFWFVNFIQLLSNIYLSLLSKHNILRLNALKLLHQTAINLL